jgi:hypothetical protein
MNSSETKETLTFDYHTIRLIIGLIAMSLPVVVAIRAGGVTDSISWSYHTDARDCFVGSLFVIGAFLISYKGHKPTLNPNEVGKFWIWMSSFWKGAIEFRIWEKQHEEDIVSWVGGIAAVVTALFPTGDCLAENCPFIPVSQIHYGGAIVVFATTVYFCLFAFMARAKSKMEQSGMRLKSAGLDPRQKRKWIYSICGWGIALVLLVLLVLKSASVPTFQNMTFWAETLALELFGFAWLTASQYLPFITEETERQKFFFEGIFSGRSAQN